MSLKVLLDIQTLSKRFALKESKIRSMVMKNELPVIRVGRLLRFDEDDIALWLEKQKEKSKSKN